MKQTSGLLARLNPRERLLLGLMFGAFAIIGFAIFLMKTGSAVEAKEAELQNTQMVITILSQQGTSFARTIQENTILESQLSEPNVELLSFLENYCRREGLAIPSYYNESRTTLRNGLEEYTTEATVDNVRAASLANLLSGIDNDPKLVIFKVIELRRLQIVDQYTLNLTLATYRDPEEQ